MAYNYYLGTITLGGMHFVPRDFYACGGQLISIADNQALFSLISNTFGGDGRSTFAVPDLRGRTPIGSGIGPGLTPRNLGDRFGTEEVALDETTLPAHAHAGDTLTVSLSSVSVDLTSVRGTQYTSDLPGDTDNSSDAYFAQTVNEDIFTEDASANNAMRPGTIQLVGTPTLSGTPVVSGEVSSTGQGLPHENMQPSLVMNYFICVNGIYPSRT
ncbi:MAG: tail fiber protein [Balneolales bacterium]|nr:tail fiber protein [Balneolales bacterium]